MDFAEQLRILEVAQGNPALLALATIDFALGARPEAERARLKEALLAVAVPHWCDSTFLAALLETTLEEGARLLGQLRTLTVIEPFPAHGPEAVCVLEATRLALREYLRTVDGERWAELSKRARGHVVASHEPHLRIEAVYHLFAIDKVVAGEKYQSLYAEFAGTAPAEVLGGLQLSLRELVEAGWTDVATLLTPPCALPAGDAQAPRVANLRVEDLGVAPQPATKSAVEWRPRGGFPAPCVFLSYRQESLALQRAVAALADRLRAAGLAVELDVHVKAGGPDEGWTKWCEDRAEKCEAVLVVSSRGWFDAYDLKGPEKAGLGAAWEARILRNQIAANKGLNARMRFVELPLAGPCDYPAALNDIHRFRPIVKLKDFDEMVAWAGERLRVAPPDLGKKSKVVYLAKMLVDEDGLRGSLAEELRERGWNVLPEGNYNEDHYAEQASRDMSRALAFIQLLEKFRWQDGDRDFLQYAAAQQAGVKCLRYRDPELRPNDIKDSKQRDFVCSDPHIRRNQFDDFKEEVFRTLDEVWTRLEAPPGPAAAAGRPLPFLWVVMRAGNPDGRWETVSRWLSDHTDIAVDTLESYELDSSSLSLRYRARPFQGILLLCDQAAMDQPELSPRPLLRECMEIQLDTKDSTRCPRVGIVYWPPPPEDEVWPKLLRSRPVNLHPLRGSQSQGCPADVQAFLDAVRGVTVL